MAFYAGVKTVAVEFENKTSDDVGIDPLLKMHLCTCSVMEERLKAFSEPFIMNSRHETAHLYILRLTVLFYEGKQHTGEIFDSMVAGHHLKKPHDGRLNRGRQGGRHKRHLSFHSHISLVDNIFLHLRKCVHHAHKSAGLDIYITPGPTFPNIFEKGLGIS